MQNFILYFGIVMFALLSFTVSSELSIFSRSMQYTKEDLEVAVHDGGLQLDYERFANGEIVFNQTQALAIIKESFELNTGFGVDDYTILEFQVFDHSNSSFPVTFNSSTINFSDTFSSPTILVIIQTNTNKYFFTSLQKEITRVASYSYELNNSEG